MFPLPLTIVQPAVSRLSIHSTSTDKNELPSDERKRDSLTSHTYNPILFRKFADDTNLSDKNQINTNRNWTYVDDKPADRTFRFIFSVDHGLAVT